MRIVDSADKVSRFGHRRAAAGIVAAATAALVMGLPTLRGGFVGGDDHRLLLNHVLVNHPSLPHALKLFTIVHRDLYQPLPLLSFSAEFAVARALGLFEGGEDAGARLFHLTNMLLHAANTVLVWALIATLQTGLLARAGGGQPDDSPGPRAVATLAALLFAVHPLQAEVIAWTNGRMMLMSTLFALASMLALASWLDKGKRTMAAVTVVFVLLSAISKVRIGLPVLLLLVGFTRRAKLSGRFVFLWASCGLVTGAFVCVNVWATAGADLFAQGAEHLAGPRAVRVLLALAWYFQHVSWPTGLASYYPAPPLVRWSDPATGWSAMILLLALLVLAWSCRSSRAARFGVVWFFATIASTLPFFPARNILAADRYMYLPIIGLFWLIAVTACTVYRRRASSWPVAVRRLMPATAGAVALPLLIGIGWHVASFYRTPLRKTARIAALFPGTPRVWEKLGWCHYSGGRYREAIECAQKELRHDAPQVRSGAYQLLGMSELRLGNAERAIELLHKAVSIDPNTALGRYRLALAYDELGRTEEAVPHFEAAVEAAPQHNPTINRLASAYRRLGRPDDARAEYEQAIVNNPYEVPAVMGLAELDIEKGTTESYRSAERRLETLLRWMPENVNALVNLGKVRYELGRREEAKEAYQDALKRDPGHVTAALNLAQIYEGDADFRRARALFERAARGGLASVDQAVVVHDFFVSQREADRTVSLWEGMLKAFPDSAAARTFLAWSYALAGKPDRAEAQTRLIRSDGPRPPLVWATLAYVDFLRQRYEAAAGRARALSVKGAAAADARRRFLGALERFDANHPDIPWTFCLAAQLLIADGNPREAGLFMNLCKERCDDPSCREHVRNLRSQLDTYSVHSRGAAN